MSHQRLPGHGVDSAAVGLKPIDEVSADFDRIARALRKTHRPERLSAAERWLIRQIPMNAQTAIDVGCGDGRLARALARRGLTVMGIDASTEMIAVARERTDVHLPIEFHAGDITKETEAPVSFDVVLSVAMVHHLKLNEIVPLLARLVASGGVLLIQDVTSRSGLRYLPSNVIAALRSRFLRLVRGSATSSAVARLYEEHGRHERYLSPSEVSREYRSLLPDAVITNHIEWRYSVVWRRPLDA